MAKTQDLRRRIRSIRNTMQLTRAMKMVSASKLRRSQERIMRSRPYARRTREILRSVAARANPEVSPLLQPGAGDQVLLLVITADKGLCGAFNAGIIRTAQAFIRHLPAGRQLALSVVGKKGRDYFARRGALRRQWVDVFRDIDYATAKEIADELMQAFISGEFAAIHLAYNEFKSAIQARPVVQQLLPIEPREIESDRAPGDYIYEPDPAQLLEALLPHYVENQVYQALLESAAAEHAARMAAMDSATNNAGELIESLTLTMNRVRQASITTEIIEVISGAQAQG